MLLLATLVAIRRLLARAKQSSADILQEMDDSFIEPEFNAEDMA